MNYRVPGGSVSIRFIPDSEYKEPESSKPQSQSKKTDISFLVRFFLTLIEIAGIIAVVIFFARAFTM